MQDAWKQATQTERLHTPNARCAVKNVRPSSRTKTDISSAAIVALKMSMRGNVKVRLQVNKNFKEE